MLWFAVAIYLLAHPETSALITDEAVAKQWLDEYNAMAERVGYEYVLGHWIYSTNLTEYNQNMAVSHNSLCVCVRVWFDVFTFRKHIFIFVYFHV